MTEFYQVYYDKNDPRAKQWEKLNFCLRRLFNRLGETDVTTIQNVSNITSIQQEETRYSNTFNSSSDWGSPSGGLYTINFTHNKETTVLIVQVWDTDTGEMVLPESISIVDVNNVRISVSAVPDYRFNGRIVIS